MLKLNNNSCLTIVTQLFCLAIAWVATGISIVNAQSNQNILPPEKAFEYEVTVSNRVLIVDWTIQPGYYLYRNKLKFSTLSPGVKLGTPDLPTGESHSDKFFGASEIYRDTVTARVPIIIEDESVSSLLLFVDWQGCADIGFCYPPTTWESQVSLVGAQTLNDRGQNLLTLLGQTPSHAEGQQQFLRAKEAFQPSIEIVDPYHLRVSWYIADGYYLYRDKFEFEAVDKAFQIGQPQIPAGKKKFDEYFGDTEALFHEVSIDLPIVRATPDAQNVQLLVRYQGCAENGICYPPTEHGFSIRLPQALSSDQPNIPLISTETVVTASAPVSEQDRLAMVIRDSNIFWMALVFIGIGILLAFTPCVLPMVPILSSLIVGQGDRLTTRRAFVLSSVYVLAMALTYTIAGVVTAMLGQNLQAAFQHPVALIGFALIFVVLALAMFDVFTIQMPRFVQRRAQQISDQQQSGNLGGVAMMGVLSALIVGPCIAAPLVAALIVIAQMGDAIRGGAALFALSIGMGIPLIIFGTSAGKWMPKAGPWMNTIKAIFGFLMLGIAVWMLSRLMSTQAALLTWAALMVGLAVYAMRRFHPQWFRILVGIAALGYASVLSYGAFIGAVSPLHPLSPAAPSIEFSSIKSLSELQSRLDSARRKNKPVMMDFYADWCVACKEFEHYTFTDTSVIESLSDFMLLQADVTANDKVDRELQDHFDIFGPPTILFFDRLGREQPQYRVVGFMKAEPFNDHVTSFAGSLQ
ncbi:MAG: protein-disulfide reductase DsbD [Gammaproteobacteria bacterium]|nr:protein-disulfide reductase DsbD [Gammaproteobacteria bacterium]